MIHCYKAKQVAKYKKSGNKCKDDISALASSKAFDHFIMGCIVVNTICMTITWHRQPASLTTAMETVNSVFTVVYTIEAAIKIYIHRCYYFSDGWNRFDFVIVVSAWIGIVVEQLFKIAVGDLVTIMRTFRISRVFKMVKSWRPLRKIF
jgi:hypothetical protein